MAHNSHSAHPQLVVLVLPTWVDVVIPWLEAYLAQSDSTSEKQGIPGPSLTKSPRKRETATPPKPKGIHKPKP